MLLLTASTECLESVKQIIASEYRLDELIDLVTEETSGIAHISISSEGISLSVDWTETLPPILLYSMPYTADNLLAVIFLKVGNWEKAYAYAQHNLRLAETIDALNRLQSGVELQPSPEPLTGHGTPYTYRRWHNRAVMLHYGSILPTPSASQIQFTYQQALATATDAEYSAFTTKQYAVFLLDSGQLSEADKLLSRALSDDISQTARYELKAVQYAIWLQQVTVPYDPALIERLKTVLWEVLTYYEQEQRLVQAGMLLIDAAQVANFTNSFSEALGYINRAIAIFRSEDVAELVANAHYRKGVLLFTWAQNGNIQFYRPAMEAYQEALKVFTQRAAPDIFAEIQHHLGVIYSEIPDEAPKKGLWAAVSTSSFKQALTYFTRAEFPYEYATICNHYANALTKYPDAKLTDKYAKAIDLYREALAIRTAEAYPYERALTILNYLEAGWFASQEEEANQDTLLADMIGKAEEINNLVTDEALRADAQKHLYQLIRLRNQPA